jgi:hypothetical protein
MSRRIAVLLVAAVPLAQALAAEVLTAENEVRLCTASHEGQRAVDRDALAFAIVVQSGAERYLDGSNPTGLRDGAIQLQSVGDHLSEPAYVMLNGFEHSKPAANRPFGPNVDLAVDEQAMKALEKISEFRVQLDLLILKGSLTAESVRYRTEGKAQNASVLFLPNPPLVIICESQAQPPIPESDESPAFLSRLRLRGAVKDLTIKQSDPSNTQPASISYERDGVADTKTFGLNGVIGLPFSDADGQSDAIPFVSYENRSVTGDVGDIRKLSPGLLLGKKTPAHITLHTRLEASVIFDSEQESRQGKLRAYVDPAIPIGRVWGTLFGVYLKRKVGPLRLRPDLTLLLDGTHVYREGTSSELAGASDYLGAGGELSLRSRLDLGAPMSDFILQVGRRHLSLFSDIPEDHAARWFASLGFSPENSSFVGIALTLSKGENDDTFQDEETYSLALAFRY